MSIETTSATMTENNAAYDRREVHEGLHKANGAATQAEELAACPVYDPPTSIFAFVNQNKPWKVILADHSQPTSFKRNSVFRIVATSNTEADIEFTDPLMNPLNACFDPNTGVLSYEVIDPVESGHIFLLQGDRPSLSAVTYVGDPEPVAVWAADEDGGGGS